MIERLRLSRALPRFGESRMVINSSSVFGLRTGGSLIVDGTSEGGGWESTAAL